MLLDYRSIIQIDEGCLDTEWARHSSCYMDVIEAQVAASEQLDKLRDKLSGTEAIIACDVRRNPEMYGAQKITDQVVKEIVASSDKIIVLQSEILQARRQLALLNGVVTAMEHRKKALENLVELYVCNYQSEPRPLSRVGREEADQILNQPIHNKIGNSFTKRARS